MSLPTTSASSTGPATRTFAELLIDCEEDRTLRAVLVGMLWEDERPDSGEAGLDTSPSAVAMLRKIKEVTTEMAANGFTAIVTGSGYVQRMNAANLQTVDDTLRLHDKLTGASRRKTPQAMRRDLLPWWHLSSRDLPDKPQVVA